MNQKSKLFGISMAMLLVFTSVSAQDGSPDGESLWSIGADFVSRYIWRGVNLGGSSPSIQPYIEFDFGNDDHSFAVGAWGAYSVSAGQTGQEADLYFTYTIKNLFSLTLTDYFFPDETVSRNSYFNYNMDWAAIDNGDSDQTGHVVEAALSFNGTDNFPVSLMFAMNVWGADSRKYVDDAGAMVPADGIVMSKYIELGYSTGINGSALELFAGFSLDNPDIENGEPAGFYGQESAGLINLGLTLSREIGISDSYSLPVSGSLISNPEAGNIFMVFGISF
ncbi:MAG: hypothetical protein R2744_03295 [Bacteroidales bacterium]